MTVLPARPIRDPRAKPACMTAAEWAEWSIPNARLRPSNPCTECPIAFAIAQRAVHACDGIPHGATDAPPLPGEASRWGPGWIELNGSVHTHPRVHTDVVATTDDAPDTQRCSANRIPGARP